MSHFKTRLPFAVVQKNSIVGMRSVQRHGQKVWWKWLYFPIFLILTYESLNCAELPDVDLIFPSKTNKNHPEYGWVKPTSISREKLSYRDTVQSLTAKYTPSLKCVLTHRPSICNFGRLIFYFSTAKNKQKTWSRT